MEQVMIMSMADRLFLPLMVGSITGAGLTLTGGSFLEEYAKERVEHVLGRPINDLMPIPHLLLSVKRRTLATVIIFLLSEVLLVGYVAFDCPNMVWVSYIFFFAGVLLLLFAIIYTIMSGPLPL